MRKHRNPVQERIFVEFMESHQDIARGYVKGDRVVAEALWTELTEKLNSFGPPSKDCNGWKKTWADWKIYVKKKVCHNKQDNEKTGGGQYNKYVLTYIEEYLARVSGIHRIVDVVAGARSFGEMELYRCESDEENEEGELTSTSKNAKKNDENDSGSSDESIRNSTPAFKRRRSRTQSPDSKRYNACAPCTQRTPLKSDSKAVENETLLQTDLYNDVKKSLSEIERYSRKTFELQEEHLKLKKEKLIMYKEHFKLKKEKLILYKEQIKKREGQRSAMLKLKMEEIDLKRRKIEIEESINVLK